MECGRFSTLCGFKQPEDRLNKKSTCSDKEPPTATLIFLGFVRFFVSSCLHNVFSCCAQLQPSWPHSVIRRKAANELSPKVLQVAIAGKVELPVPFL